MIDLNKDTNIALQISARAAEAGVSVKTLCDRAGVRQPTITAWKADEPTAIKTLRKLNQALEEIKQDV